ncbi:MerR family transcriptional regulator [Nocardia sp. BMG51109]|uniref:MerR family transcriptional regulator n=1 Tax=Nocardia sp. BMG51109 TaxID=1056816 RepID=UPI00046749AC|nr:MerR family transcriptional regulator [Nocardia sp. BMG51109]
MTWSTRQLAELAGTTVRAVRHYHDIGLLDEPERGSNGYKQYGARDLLRVLRIKRLADLGIPLSQIAAMGEADRYPHEALQTLDAELASTIDRLQRIRVELALLMKQGSPTDLPPELGEVVAGLSEADRSYTTILTRVLGPTALDSLREMLHATRDDPAGREFEQLPEDADERTRADLAERMVPYVRDLHAEYPNLSQVDDSPVGPRRATEALAVGLRDLYNKAQLDVLVRVNQQLNAPDRE